MDDFLVRPAAADDFPAIRALIFAVHINPTGLDWRRFIVAVTPASELIGCGQVKPHVDGSKELASIAVRKQFRGRGAARAIIEKLLAQESQRPLYLMCRARLELLYARFGFRPVNFDELSPYFRRISRISRIGRLLDMKTPVSKRLLIMRLG